MLTHFQTPHISFRRFALELTTLNPVNEAETAETVFQDFFLFYHMFIRLPVGAKARMLRHRRLTPALPYTSFLAAADSDLDIEMNACALICTVADAVSGATDSS